MALVGRKTLIVACGVSYVFLFALFYAYLYGVPPGLLGGKASNDDDNFQATTRPKPPKQHKPKAVKTKAPKAPKEPQTHAPTIAAVENQQYEFPQNHYTFWTSDFGMSSTHTFARLAYSMKLGNSHQRKPVELSLLHRGHTLDACNYFSKSTSTSNSNSNSEESDASSSSTSFVAQFLQNTCANHRPSPFSFTNAYDMSPSHDTSATRQELWRIQRSLTSSSTSNDQASLFNVDAFWCTNPMSLCEVFMPYNKPMILYAGGSTGSGARGNNEISAFAMGRTHTNEKQWQSWVSNVQKIASKPQNLVIASNMYDAAYMRYFTGLHDIAVIDAPEFVNNNNKDNSKPYTGKDKRILVAPFRINSAFITNLVSSSNQQQQQSQYTLHFASSVYSNAHQQKYEAKGNDAATEFMSNHAAILFIPMLLPTDALFEHLYKHNIPLIVPSAKLMAEWIVKGFISVQRGLSSSSSPAALSYMKKHSSVEDVDFDPHNWNSAEHVEHWLSLTNYYNTQSWPHVIYFDSVEDLQKNILNTDNGKHFTETSQAMAKFNTKHAKLVAQEWSQLLHKVLTSAAVKKQYTEEENADRVIDSIYK